MAKKLPKVSNEQVGSVTISTAEKFYILKSGKTPEDLSEEMGLPVEVIKSVKVEEEKKKDVHTTTITGTKMKDLMGKKKDRGVTVMTPGASMVSDDYKRSLKNKIDESHIYRRPDSE